MPTYCCVPMCKHRGSGHSFPKEPKLLAQWKVAIRRIDARTKKEWIPSPYSKVCSNHFTPDDYRVGESLLGERKRLKAGAVPSVFDFNEKQSNTAYKRKLQTEKRVSQNQQTFQPVSHREILEDGDDKLDLPDFIIDCSAVEDPI